MSDTHGCRAHVTIVLEVRGTGAWGKEATVEEVQRIGGREAINSVLSALNQSNISYHVVKTEVGAITWGPVHV